MKVIDIINEAKDPTEAEIEAIVKWYAEKYPQNAQTLWARSQKKAFSWKSLVGFKANFLYLTAEAMYRLYVLDRAAGVKYDDGRRVYEAEEINKARKFIIGQWTAAVGVQIVFHWGANSKAAQWFAETLRGSARGSWRGKLVGAGGVVIAAAFTALSAYMLTMKGGEDITNNVLFPMIFGDDFGNVLGYLLKAVVQISGFTVTSAWDWLVKKIEELVGKDLWSPFPNLADVKKDVEGPESDINDPEEWDQRQKQATDRAWKDFSLNPNDFKGNKLQYPR